MIGILLLLATNFLSGYSLFRIFYRNANTLEKILLPQVFSLIVTPLLFVSLYLVVGFNSAILLSPVLIVSMFIVSLRLKQESHKLDFNKKVIPCILFLISLFSAIMFFQYFFQLPYLQDTTNYIAISNEIKNYKTLPPNNPCLYGTKLNYQWFYHLFLALISVYSDISVFLILPVFTVYLISLAISTGFLLGYSYFKKEAFGIVFIAVLSLVFLAYYVSPQPQGYSLILILSFFYTFLQSLKTKYERFILLSGIIAASLIYIHGLSFIFVGLFLLSYSLYRMVFDLNKRAIRELFILIVPLVLSLPYYLIIEKYVSSAFLFQPLYGIMFNYVKMFNVLLILLPFGIYRAIKKDRKEQQMIFLMFLITLLTFVNIFTALRSNAIDRFVTYMIFPILFISFDFLGHQKKTIAYALMAVIIAIFAYNFLGYVSFDYRENFSSLNEYAISMWIKENSIMNESILTSPSSIYVALSERKIPVCEPLSQSSFFYDPRGQFADLILMYTSPSQELYKKYNIRYIVLGSKEYSFFNKYDIAPYDFQDSPVFGDMLHYRDSIVFGIRNMSALPLYTDANAKNKLNFTSYSRWWEI